MPRREGLQVYEPLPPTPTREHAPQRHERQDEPREPRVPGDDERYHQQPEPRPQKAGHATLPTVERPLDFPRAVPRFLDAMLPHFEQRTQRVAPILLALDGQEVPPLENTPERELMDGSAAVGVPKPGHATPILARGRGPTARGRCHLSRPRGSRTRSVSGRCHAHYSRSTRCQSRAPSRRGGQSAALEPLPAFVCSVLYGPASRRLPPAAPPPSGKRASVA